MQASPPGALQAAALSGDRGARPTELGRLGASKQAINPLINDLERWGYLERRRDPSDQRGRLLFLTARGRERWGRSGSCTPRSRPCGNKSSDSADTRPSTAPCSTSPSDTHTAPRASEATASHARQGLPAFRKSDRRLQVRAPEDPPAGPQLVLRPIGSALGEGCAGCRNERGSRPQWHERMAVEVIGREEELARSGRSLPVEQARRRWSSR